jgi:D-alanyl-D-alanine carboxypeptidase
VRLRLEDRLVGVVDPAWGWTAGELISTNSDLLTYGRALGTGQGVLDAKTQAERLASVPGPAGYGLAFGCAGGWVGHTGELPGFNTNLFHHTGSDITVAVQVNSDIASGTCTESPTLADDHTSPTAVCSAPATRIMTAIATALDHPFAAPPQR